MKLIDKKALATDVITHDVSPLTVNTDAGAYSKLGWWIVLLGVAGFLLWAIFAPLDKGVPMSGNVAKENNRKAIQYMQGGTVDDILVREGDLVKAGQVLVRMNGVQARSQAGITDVQYIAARATEARLIAERDGKSSVVFPPELLAMKGNPKAVENMSLQQLLFSSRRLELQNELGAGTQSIVGLKAQIAGTEASRDGKRQQLVILKEQLEGLRDLSKDGYIPRAKLLDQERTYMQINSQIAEDTGNIGRSQSQIIELGLKAAQRNQQFQREVRTQLADVQKEAEALAARAEAEKYNVTNVDVKSPADGVVMGMAIFTKGGVVQPGFRMMDVVPTADALVVEGRLPVNLVDRVKPGLKVDLIFSAFNTNTTPHIPGEVTKVSADRLLDEHNGTPYYSVLAKVSPAGLKQLQEHKLDVRPGMPVELFVKTGERTMMSYLLKPVMDRAKTSLTEE